MTRAWVEDRLSTERAKEVARRTLDGEHDLLLACRDLARLRGHLPDVADEIMNVFVGVASEVDDLPIGAERKQWAAEALRLKDIEATGYREQVRGVVEKALQELLAVLGGKSNKSG